MIVMWSLPSVSGSVLFTGDGNMQEPSSHDPYTSLFYTDTIKSNTVRALAYVNSLSKDQHSIKSFGGERFWCF